MPRPRRQTHQPAHLQDDGSSMPRAQRQQPRQPAHLDDGDGQPQKRQRRVVSEPDDSLPAPFIAAAERGLPDAFSPQGTAPAQLVRPRLDSVSDGAPPATGHVGTHVKELSYPVTLSLNNNNIGVPHNVTCTNIGTHIGAAASIGVSAGSFAAMPAPPELIPQVEQFTPLGMNVPMSLKEKIWNGTYVDLSQLLP